MSSFTGHPNCARLMYRMIKSELDKMNGNANLFCLINFESTFIWLLWLFTLGTHIIIFVYILCRNSLLFPDLDYTKPSIFSCVQWVKKISNIKIGFIIATFRNRGVKVLFQTQFQLYIKYTFIFANMFLCLIHQIATYYFYSIINIIINKSENISIG